MNEESIRWLEAEYELSKVIGVIKNCISVTEGNFPDYDIRQEVHCARLNKNDINSNNNFRKKMYIGGKAENSEAEMMAVFVETIEVKSEVETYLDTKRIFVETGDSNGAKKPSGWVSSKADYVFIKFIGDIRDEISYRQGVRVHRRRFLAWAEDNNYYMKVENAGDSKFKKDGMLIWIDDIMKYFKDEPKYYHIK